MALDREKFEWLAEKGLRHGGSTHSVNDIIDGLRSGNLQSFHNEDGMVITMLAEYPEKKVLEMVLALGTQDAIRPLIAHDLVEYGNNHKADYIRAMVRPGLIDFFKGLGGKTKGAMMYRQLGLEG